MQPTGPELAILKVLWNEEPLAAKDIHKIVVKQLDWSYSSTRRTLDRMVEKKFIEIVTRANKNNYQTKVEKINVLANFAQDLARRVFELDSPLPVTMFADSRLIDDSEIDDLEKMLDELAKESN